MTREELLTECQRIRTLRTSPPTLSRQLNEDEEIADVVEAQSNKSPKKPRVVKPSIDINVLIAAAAAHHNASPSTSR